MQRLATEGTSVRRAKPETRWAHPVDWRGADSDDSEPFLILRREPRVSIALCPRITSEAPDDGHDAALTSRCRLDAESKARLRQLVSDDLRRRHHLLAIRHFLMLRVSGELMNESASTACMGMIERCPPGKLAHIACSVERWHRTCCPCRD